MTSAEHLRLQHADQGTAAWRAWGPYVSERAWGTVREDYSAYGEAWDSFPHDHARSRVYRWNEDGMAGVCDERQTFCLALALWNGVDPILKERMFGLTGPEGNHGEDVKDYWWYLDSTPTHSWVTWRYHYPQRPFPYTDLVEENRHRGKDAPEYELVDTGVFAQDETNTQRLYGVPGRSAYPKDGINDHVVTGAGTVNPGGIGTKGALWYRLDVPAGGRAMIRLRLTAGDNAGDLGEGYDAVMTARRAEADDFYQALTPAEASVDDALVLRQAMAGMLWGKQFFHYDVARWLDGDPAGPPPPPRRRDRQARNSSWRHLNNADVISTPDPWEYPWYAAWDLAFHCVPLARLDPTFAKHQLLLLLREWYMHPGGQLPAYEWAFGDVNPPVHAWAALRVFENDGSRDFDFLARVFHKLLLNFTWWVNRKDSEENNIFEGGFLGLDNIGPVDRSKALPVAGVLEQSDGTAWMAMYCLNLLEMALVLAEHDRAYEDLATKFFEHFALIAAAAHDSLWDPTDGFFYDVLSAADGRRIPLRVRSMVGLLPLCATTTLGSAVLQRLPDFAARMRWFLTHLPQYAGVVGETHIRDGFEGRLLSMVGPEQLRRILAPMLSEQEFLSPHGLRSVSRRHRDAPFVLDLPELHASVDYEPAESTIGLFGGNSNWRGPVWFPVNYLLVEAIGRFAQFFGDDFVVEHPTGSGVKRTLAEVAADLTDRLISTFRNDSAGRRPVFGDYELFQTDPHWHDQLWFHEYFHGDTGAGLGASHQTGWTGLVAACLLHRPDPVE
ncbi:MAG: glucosidase [Pseudonocardiaceae bacterium]